MASLRRVRSHAHAPPRSNRVNLTGCPRRPALTDCASAQVYPMRRAEGPLLARAARQLKARLTAVVRREGNLDGRGRERHLLQRSDRSVMHC
jgi:hypothetical protein